VIPGVSSSGVLPSNWRNRRRIRLPLKKSMRGTKKKHPRAHQISTRTQPCFT
jgi:hypothetical protein